MHLKIRKIFEKISFPGIKFLVFWPEQISENFVQANIKIKEN